MMSFKVVLSCIMFFTFVFADGLGEFPHGDVYFAKPSLDKRTVEVELKVDLSQVYLKNKYIHVVEERSPRVYEDIYAPEVSALQATVFYHADYAYKFLVRNGFIVYGEQIKIVLSHSRNADIILLPFKLQLVFGEAGLNEHALDADIIYSSVARLLLMNSLGLSSDESLTVEGKAILYGISYFLACSMVHRPDKAYGKQELHSRVIKTALPRDGNENLSLSFARVLWGISLDSSVSIVNRLISETTLYMSEVYSINYFVYRLIRSDIYLFDGVHSDLIYQRFDEAGMVKGN